MAEGEVVMDGRRFGRLCAGIGRLTVGQMRALRRRLRGLDARTELPARIDARAQALQRCLHGGATALRRWGGTRSGPRRRRCRGCRRTFSAASGTALARVRRPEQVQLALADMRSRRPSSCRAPAPRRGVDKMAVWRWRRRLLAGLTGIGATRLHGIVEADEKDFRESRKGSREWVNHERNPALFPKPDRPRWRDDQRLGLLRPAGVSRRQIPVLTLTDRGGARRADMLPERRAPSLVALLERRVGQDAALGSDGDGAYDLLARARALPHCRLNPRTGPKVIDTAFHLQTVNSLHSRFARLMRPFRGPATKSLPRYAAWLIIRRSGDEAAAHGAAWRRLLAARPTRSADTATPFRTGSWTCLAAGWEARCRDDSQPAAAAPAPAISRAGPGEAGFVRRGAGCRSNAAAGRRAHRRQGHRIAAGRGGPDGERKPGPVIQSSQWKHVEAHGFAAVISLGNSAMSVGLRAQ
jgi:transposase-like protein